jgi:hypothetical protein
LNLGDFDHYGSKVSAAGKLAYTTIFVPGSLLIVLHLLHHMTGMMHVLMHRCVVMRGMGLHGDMAVTTHSLHRDRRSQRIAAKQRQPEGQQNGNKFSR